ncbi:PREDICTED: protein DEHYDRATION-INDUCED 19 isoform X2 [Camelina sativa]|uniref:Protein DEHYDRATION-INDUCED 19 isoform X2 n=1 Tax=Camelina sativa TaxID=90675 RepID=A0ABM0Z6V5_CAMSA|nr:PREDICTED: protein DEHYDRATION-INDUCED 19 isoform X2 [Camelina sativa]
MDADSKRFLATLRSRSEMLMGFEEIDGDDDFQEEFACPFCAESFDIIGLCCHIDDEHTLESKNAVCPVCSLKVGVDIVAHITLHHGSLFKLQRKRKSRKSGTNSTLSFLRKELREGDLQRLLGFTSRNGSVPPPSGTPDPLVSSFISPTRSQSSPVTRQTKKVSEEKHIERIWACSARDKCASHPSHQKTEKRGGISQSLFRGSCHQPFSMRSDQKANTKIERTQRN